MPSCYPGHRGRPTLARRLLGSPWCATLASDAQHGYFLAQVGKLLRHGGSRPCLRCPLGWWHPAATGGPLTQNALRLALTGHDAFQTGLERGHGKVLPCLAILDELV